MLDEVFGTMPENWKTLSEKPFIDFITLHDFYSVGFKKSYYYLAKDWSL